MCTTGLSDGQKEGGGGEGGRGGATNITLA